MMEMAVWLDEQYLDTLLVCSLMGSYCTEIGAALTRWVAGRMAASSFVVAYKTVLAMSFRLKICTKSTIPT